MSFKSKWSKKDKAEFDVVANKISKKCPDHKEHKRNCVKCEK